METHLYNQLHYLRCLTDFGTTSYQPIMYPLEVMPMPLVRATLGDIHDLLMKSKGCVLFRNKLTQSKSDNLLFIHFTL